MARSAASSAPCRGAAGCGTPRCSCPTPRKGAKHLQVADALGLDDPVRRRQSAEVDIGPALGHRQHCRTRVVHLHKPRTRVAGQQVFVHGIATFDRHTAAAKIVAVGKIGRALAPDVDHGQLHIAVGEEQLGLALRRTRNGGHHIDLAGTRRCHHRGKVTEGPHLHRQLQHAGQGLHQLARQPGVAPVAIHRIDGLPVLHHPHAQGGASLTPGQEVGRRRDTRQHLDLGQWPRLGLQRERRHRQHGQAGSHKPTDRGPQRLLWKKVENALEHVCQAGHAASPADERCACRRVLRQVS